VADDIQEIQALKARYARLVDTKQWEAWRELLTEDVRLEGDAGVHEGREVVVAMVSSALAGATTVHHVMAPEITITGPDTATGIWGYEDLVELRRGETTITVHGHGHYHEEYLRTPDGWKVRSSTAKRLRVDTTGLD